TNIANHDPELAKVRSLKRDYGLTLEEYEAMIKDQNGRCAICNEIPKEIPRKNGVSWRFAVDHCHESGKVRALLCVRCNTALGHFRDNPQYMIAAAGYIQKHQSKQSE